MTRMLDSSTKLPVDLEGPEGRDAVSRLAIQIVAACHGEGGQSMDGGLISLPSERELSLRLRMSRHAVRNALSHLQRQGLVCRPNGRGPLLVAKSMPVVRKNQDNDLRCINFIINSSFESRGLHWLRDEYLAGYTEVLEHESCKTRHVIWRAEEADFESLLWCHTKPQSQACMIMGRRDPALLNWLSEHEVPYVVQNYCRYDHHGLPPHHKVFVNKTGAAFAATQRLVELGHRRIGFIGPMPLPDRLWPEYEGFLAGLHCAGLTPDPEDLLDLNTEVLQEAMGPVRRMLDRRSRPTAYVSGGGSVTVALLKSAEALGISVPEEFSIIGFDDEKTPAFPHLSTIAVPRRALGRQAVELLLEAVRNPTMEPQTRMVECQLNYQRSIGPAPG